MDDYAEFRHFRYLLAVAEHKGFRAAAEALHTSQPSLSRQVKEFQERYNLRLFRRLKGGRIVLTPAGEALRVIAKDVLETRELALAALEAIQAGQSEVLRLGCTPFVDKALCRRVVDLHKSLVPAAIVRVSSGDTAALLHGLLGDRLDAAVATLPVSDERLQVEIIRRDRLVVCLPADHELARKPALSAADLTRNLTVFRHPAQHPEAHERLRELLAELGVEFEEHSHTSHPQEMQEAVQRREGFALLREGTPLLEGLITRSIQGVEWTVDTAFVFNKEPRLKLLPIIARSLRKQYLGSAHTVLKMRPRVAPSSENPEQMKLIG
jgi:DNA-binding transcriptional LysR family regulator